MQKILLTFYLLLLTSLAEAGGSSFDKLWKQVQVAEGKDQPKSVLAAIGEIEAKAERERSYGNLLAAMLKEINVQQEISPDSVKAAKKRMARKQTVWRSNGCGVEAALADVALNNAAEESFLDSLLASRDSALFRKTDSALKYVPLTIKGEDSKYFNNDLLSMMILTDDKGKSTTDLLEKYYGVDNKVVRWRRLGEAVFAEKDTGKKIAMIDKGLAEWKGWKELNTLKNIRNDLTCPEFSAEIAKQVLSTHDDVKIAFRGVRNIGSVRVTLSNVKGEKRTYSHVFHLANEWEVRSGDTLNIGRLPLGKWAVSIMDDKQEVKTNSDTLIVTDLKFLTQKLPKDKVRIVVVDATTGKPVPDATVYYKDEYRGKTERHTATDANGECVIARGEAGRRSSCFYMRATKDGDTAMPLRGICPMYECNHSQPVHSYLDLYSDRAIYRRGQTVHVTAICHAVYNGKETLAEAGERVTLVFENNRGKEIERKSVVTDGYGTATADFVIPEDGINGTYRISAKSSVTNIVFFKVEDYKRPTFEVKLESKEESGEKGTVIGLAKTYSGVPVANAKAVCTVKRSRGWWIGWRDNGEEIRRDTLYTDADGRFVINVPMTLPEDVDTTWYYCFRYTVQAMVTDNAGETQSGSITLTRKNDRPIKPEEPEKPKMLSASAESFSEDDEPVVITLRDIRPSVSSITDSDKNKSADNITAYYMLCAGDTVFDRGRLEFNDSTIYIIRYKEEYGDGITFSVAWVKDGEMYSDDVSVKKFLPSKKLMLEWGTFRNKMYPGQTETWTLQVKNPDGTPSKAQVMAVMYDKSLDALTRLTWNFSDKRVLHMPYVRWQTGHINKFYDHAIKSLKPLEEKTLTFNRIGDEFVIKSRYYMLGFSGRSGGLYEMKRRKVFDCVESNVMMAKSTAIGSLDAAKEESIVILGYTPDADNGSGEAVVPLRTNFAETAFFLPQVETDNNGVATLKFTMPESVTTWRFLALAHDKEMRYAQMDTTALTQKKIMVQGRMPRFLRVGDKATVSASVANLMEKNQTVTVNFTVKDARTEKTLYTAKKTVTVEAGRTAALPFDYEVTAEGDLLCSFTAQVQGFSDGEQHLLPVLTERELQQDTAAIVVNPRQMMMEALPDMQVPQSRNAVTLAHALFANVVAAHVKDTTVSAANDNVLVQLVNLQNSDGGFAWYGGMQSNKYITVEVLKTLARLNLMCGKQTNTEFLMDKAFIYAKAKMEEEMREMKKHDIKYLSNTALDWLYALAISKRDGGSAETFFRKMIYEQTKYDDMQTKAVAAITLNGNGKHKQAAEFAESIKQHTVYRQDMGRYFDTYRANYSWCNYRIPTHTMCIEALKDVTPQDGQTISEMLRWLVSAKRTQKWTNPINTVNAVYALYEAKDTTLLASYTVRPEDVQGALTVTRKIEAGKTMKVGDKVKVILTIEADRDYDFVTVTDNRPACLEPVNQLSGYRWNSRWGYYAEMRDSKSVYHFDKMAKGTYVVETEYYVDRAGEYLSGNASVVCEYAPEFHGTTDAVKVNVK